MLPATRRHVLRDDIVPHNGRFIHHSGVRLHRLGTNQPIRPPGPLTDSEKPTRTKPSYESLRNHVLGDDNK